MSVELIRDEAQIIVAVLILRPDPKIDPIEIARQALTVDARWSPKSTERGLKSAVVENGRWFKTPDRHNPGEFVLTKIRSDEAKAGATPGIMVRPFVVR